MNCMFCFRISKAKTSKKGTLKSISVAVKFIELPGIKHIRSGFIASAATDKYISVAAGRFEPPQICRGIRSGSFTATATDSSTYPWRFKLTNRHGYVEESVVVYFLRSPRICTPYPWPQIGGGDKNHHEWVFQPPRMMISVLVLLSGIPFQESHCTSSTSPWISSWYVQNITEWY